MKKKCEMGTLLGVSFINVYFNDSRFQLVKLMALADEPRKWQISKECRGLILR
jgi:hypothetical protein